MGGIAEQEVIAPGVGLRGTRSAGVGVPQRHRAGRHDEEPARIDDTTGLLGDAPSIRCEHDRLGGWR